jgi:nicotinamidase-related amidase
MKLHVAVIDPQWDFCWPGLGYFFNLDGPEWKTVEPFLRIALGPMLDLLIQPGKLCVKGAWEAMERVAKMIDRLRDKIDDMTVTLDSHQIVDQAHPIWFKDASGAQVSPFTLLGLVGQSIQSLDPAKGFAGTGKEFTTTKPYLLDHDGVTGKGSRGYFAALETRGRQKHVVWPVHTEIGSIGATIVPTLFAAIQRWQETFALVNFETKGSNPYTEHYGAVEAEVPDPQDPSTGVNSRIIKTMSEADLVVWAGVASTHCLPETFRGVVEHVPEAYVQKMTLLTDGTAGVPGFEFLYDKFIADMTPKGMKLSTTVGFLA